MSKLKSLIAKTIKEKMKDEIQAVAQEALKAGEKAVAEAKAPNTVAPKAPITANSMKGMSIEAQRIGELGFMVKAVKGELNEVEKSILADRFKAVGVTADVPELLPSGFTGALTHDLREQLVVTKIFPYKEIGAPGEYDDIALNGITAFLTDEATDGTESSDNYTTMIYLVKTAMGVVSKSYEVVADSMIDLVAEVRAGLIAAIAEAIENAVVNGDDSATHMDADVTLANDFRRAFKGIRKLALGKASIDAGGAALTEDEWLKIISDAQVAGGKYLNQLEVSKGNVVLIVPQSVYNQFRLFPSFRTKDKADGMATLFGAPVETVFDIPVIMTPYIPSAVDATGVVNADPAQNTKAMALLVNKNYFKYYTVRGSSLMESDKNIKNKTYLFTASIRCGFNGLFDRSASDPTAIDAERKTAVAIVNIAK